MELHTQPGVISWKKPGNTFFGEGNLNIMKPRLVKENTTRTRQAHFQLFETTQQDPAGSSVSGWKLAGLDPRAATTPVLLVAWGKRCRDPTFVVWAIEENRKRRLRRQEVVCYNFSVWQPDKTGNYQWLGRGRGCFVAQGENGGAEWRGIQECGFLSAVTENSSGRKSDLWKRLSLWRHLSSSTTQQKNKTKPWFV